MPRGKGPHSVGALEDATHNLVRPRVCWPWNALMETIMFRWAPRIGMWSRGIGLQHRILIEILRNMEDRKKAKIERSHSH